MLLLEVQSFVKNTVRKTWENLPLFHCLSVAMKLILIAVNLVYDLVTWIRLLPWIDHSSDKPLPPGSLGIPVFGETLSLILKSHEFFDENRKRYGNIYKTCLFGKNIIRISGVKNVERVLKSENTLVSSQWPNSTRLMMGDQTVSQSSGKIHQIRRKAILKGFSVNAMKEYTPGIQRTVQHHIHQWNEEHHVITYPACKRLALSVMSSAVLEFNFDNSTQEKLIEAFDQFTFNLLALPINLPGFGLYKGLEARKTIQNILEFHVQKRKQSASTAENRPGDFFSLLQRHADRWMPKNGILDIVMELLFTGLETTASAMCSLVLQLGKHPGVVKNITGELRRHGLNAVADLDFSSLHQLTYLNNVINETLRCVPPVSGFYREVLQTFELGGYQIPRGWSVALGIRETMASDFFDNFNKFDPDRWNKEESSCKRVIMSLPFGGGPRICLGKEFVKLLLKIFTVELVRHSQWHLEENFPEINFYPVAYPVSGLPTKFEAKDTTEQQQLFS